MSERVCACGSVSVALLTGELRCSGCYRSFLSRLFFKKQEQPRRTQCRRKGERLLCLTNGGGYARKEKRRCWKYKRDTCILRDEYHQYEIKDALLVCVCVCAGRGGCVSGG